MKHWLVAMIAAVATAAGCAGGAWLETPAEDLAPIVPPARGYPTAIRPAAAKAEVEHVAPAANEQQAAVQQAIDLNPNPPPAAPERHSRVEEPKLPAPALAVIPPQYRRQPTTQTAQPQPPSQTPAFPSPSPSTPLTMAEAALAPIVSASSMRLPLSPTPAAPAPTPPEASGVITAQTLATQPTPAVQPAATAEVREAEVQRLRGELIAALEADIRERRRISASDEVLPRLEQELRMAYLLDGRLDEAVSAVEALDEPQREGFKDLMFGLGVWLSPDEARRAPLRSAKVLRSLRDASSDLSAASKLELHNLAFCDNVKSFGWYSEFPRNEFAPKQQVILYVEVDNFSADRKSPGGFETELQGSYQIFDAGGQIVAERTLPLDKEVCRNYRRDYFLAYPIYMPETIAPGKYRLELSIEDRKASGKYQGRKLGEGMIEFTVR